MDRPGTGLSLVEMTSAAGMVCLQKSTSMTKALSHKKSPAFIPA